MEKDRPVPQENPSTVFLSYSRRDTNAAREIARELESRGRPCWVDWEDIPPTAAWKAEIEDAIARSDALLLLITPDSAASPEVTKEVDLALRFEKKIVPVLVERTGPEALPEAVRAIQWIDFHGDRDGALTKLITALDTDLDWVREHTGLLTQARAWEATGRERALLLRGKNLLRAEAWLTGSARKEPRPARIHGDFISASRRAATFLQRLVVALVTSALVAVTALAIAAIVQSEQRERQRQIAVAKQLGTQAVLARDQRGAGLTISALLAAESTRRLLELGDSSLEGAQALVTALQLLPRRVRWLRHPEVVWDVDLSSSGDWLATAAGRTARVWNVASGSMHAEVEHDYRVSDVYIDDNARYLLTTSRERSKEPYTLWDVTTKSKLPVPTIEYRVDVAVMSPSGRSYALSDGGSIEVYTTSPPQLVRKLQVDGDIGALRFISDETLQIDSARQEKPRGARDDSRLVRIMRDEYSARALSSDGAAIDGGAGHRRYEATVSMSGPETAFRLDPLGRWLITSSQAISDASILSPVTLALWEARAPRGEFGDEPPNHQLPHDGLEQLTFSPSSSLDFERGVVDLKFSSDGLRFATASGDFRAQVWDSQNGREVQRVDHAGTVRAVALARTRTNDGAPGSDDLLATAGSDRYAGLWKRTVGQIDRRYRPQQRPVTRGLNMSPDHQTLALNTTTLFELWNLRTGELVTRQTLRYGGPTTESFPMFHPHPRTPLIMEDRVVFAGQRSTVTYSLNGEPRGEVTYDPAGIVALAPGGDLVTVADKGSVYVRRLPDGEPITRFMQSDVREIVSNVNNQYVVAIGGGRVTLWDLTRARETLLPWPDGARAASFSPDGRWLAVGGRDVVRVFDLRSLNSTPVFKDRRVSAPADVELPDVSRVAFSPDSHIVAATWGDERFTLWPLEREARLLDERSDSLQVLAFGPDGTFAAYSRNAPIRVWNDLLTGVPREVVRIPHRENVHAMAFRRDGNVLASASSDGILLLSPVRLDDLLAETLERLPRNLSAEEWAYYVGTEPYLCTAPSLPDCERPPGKSP